MQIKHSITYKMQEILTEKICKSRYRCAYGMVLRTRMFISCVRRSETYTPTRNRLIEWKCLGFYKNKVFMFRIERIVLQNKWKKKKKGKCISGVVRGENTKDTFDNWRRCQMNILSSRREDQHWIMDNGQDTFMHSLPFVCRLYSYSTNSPRVCLYTYYVGLK